MQWYRLSKLVELQGTLVAVEILEEQVKALRERLEALPAEISEQIGNDNAMKVRVAHYLYWYVQSLSTEAIGTLLGEGITRNVCRCVGPETFEIPCSKCSQSSPMEFESRTALKEALNPGRRSWKQPICDSCKAIIKSEEEKRKAEQLKELANREGKWQIRLEELKTMPYMEYLQTPEWAETRKRALKKAGYRCQICNGNEKPLNVQYL